MSEAFGDWYDDCIKIDKFENDDVALSPDDYFYNLEFVAAAFKAGRAHQREVDAETASSMWISTDIDTDETIYSGNVGDAIREQKIDD